MSRRLRTLGIAAGLAVLGAWGIWAWQTRIWGSAYRPWNNDAALDVDRAMEAVRIDPLNGTILAQRVCRHIGPAAVRPLLPYLTDPQPAVRRTVTVSLGYVGDWSIVNALTRGLNDPQPEVRQASVLALHRLVATRAVDTLRYHAADEHDGTRGAIALALGDLPDRRNVPVLVRLARDENYAVRYMALVSLGQLGDARAVPVLLEGLADPRLQLRSASAYALGLVSGLPPHGEMELWLAWWALHETA